MYRIKEAGALSGVTVRTLRHYDKIGLLSPAKQENGYRLYSEEDMARLQQILFYRYLGFPLAKIARLLQAQETDRLPSLKEQLRLLLQERDRLLALIDTLEKTINSQQGGMTMSTSEKFKGFVWQENDPYRQEAIERYGREAVEGAAARQKGREQELTDAFNAVFFAFAANHEAGLSPAAPENCEVARRLHLLLCQSFDCTPAIFGQVGLGYVEDKRFRKNIDQFGEGTARYVSDAIQAYLAL